MDLYRNLIWVEGEKFKVRPPIAKIFDIIYKAHPHPVSPDRIVTLIWGCDDGAPPTADNMVSVYVHDLRRTLMSTAVRIENRYKSGYFIEFVA